MVRSNTLPMMSLADSAAFVAAVALPTWAKGIIIRRRAVVGLAERFGFDARAVRRMRALRDRYGEGPLLVRNPIRPQAVLFRAADVRRVLDETPDPFSPASSEKRSALSHFEPHVSLISSGGDRLRRRAFNDDVLGSGCPVHAMASGFVGVIEEEASELMRRAAHLGELNWDLFFQSWFRVVRRIVLGCGARDDQELTDMIARLRGRANWAFAAPKSRALRDAFHSRLQDHLGRAEPGSLAALVKRASHGDDIHPSHQVAQWLFAFDPGGMSTFRALALLTAHPQAMARAIGDIDDATETTDLAYLRAAIVETIRLYPTTPMVLRQTTRDTEWEEGVLAAGAGVLIYSPFLHRDETRQPNAHRFAPETWLGVDPAEAGPLIPFSAGSGACPARHLVPMLGSAMLTAILRRRRDLRLEEPERLDPLRPLPGTLDPFTLRFALAAGG